ncbi:MAG: gamma-glutamyl-gamma-aminobutyrate hydrolase family protein [Planctomycetes bacterium]|nr:gamma-glutamyl-gamma-aminobutyrate hydrolase family protein [Planctomycetota bacterium]MCC8116418.1 gamma-glutamyl-gamma-aminobutyrate hydrolase family protein [Planctomycetota bacterium]MCD7897904.1 gamma-glutamyl-gamma-aminobutyrate hydrolase family protein [Planctomycetaceae bacterium]
MIKPVIGVVPLWDDEKDSLWMLPGYVDGVTAAGGLPVILPLTTDDDDLSFFADSHDGFLFTGGHDVSPRLYGETALPRCGPACDARDAMEKRLFFDAIGRDKPVFGICRGIQAINVFLGGTLYQDLPSQLNGSVAVGHKQSPPYDRPCHPVAIAASPLRAIAGADEILVNSYHHQGIKKLAPGLDVMATSADGLVEAVFMPGARFMWAVQWHPEFALDDPVSAGLFQSFIAACTAL